MKINDLIHRHPTSSITGQDGICRVRTFFNNKEQIIVLVTDLEDKNPSSSVTNSIEKIRDSLVKKGIVSKDAIFIEHYESFNFGKGTYDLVSFKDMEESKWETLEQSDVEELLGCDSVELETPTIKNERLMDQIEIIRNDIDSSIDLEWSEDPEIIKRREEIESKMISKKEIFELIQKGGKEQEIQRLLKTDLSVFAEIYAMPDEEYICFSEFPVGNGYVDFVVFTGRSRMDVFLIEVKGSDFYLFNKGKNCKPHNKLGTAMTQIRRRFINVINKELFRKKVHEIRQEVESGITKYNSLIGSKGAVDDKIDFTENAH